MPFIYSQLLPVRASNAARHNAALLGSNTFGVEITEPELAAQCGRGNLDPQHGQKGGEVAAIEAAFDAHIPPDGSRLVTIRPDMDALGAMAILTLRAEDKPIGAALRERAALIGRADRFDFGQWPGPKPLPSSDAEWLQFASEPLGLPPVAAFASDADRTLESRVAAMRHWLETGEIPDTCRDTIAVRAANLAAAWRSSDIAISYAIDERAALVISNAGGVLRLGYRLAPVVLAMAARPSEVNAGRRKISIASYASGYINLRGLATDLEALESGWGGSATILGSPQGIGSGLPLNALIAALRPRLIPPADPTVRGNA